MIECPLPESVPRTGSVQFYCKVRLVEGYDPGELYAWIGPSDDIYGSAIYGSDVFIPSESLSTFTIPYNIQEPGPENLSIYIKNSFVASTFSHFILDYLAVKIPSPPFLRIGKNRSRGRFTKER